MRRIIEVNGNHSLILFNWDNMSNYGIGASIQIIV